MSLDGIRGYFCSMEMEAISSLNSFCNLRSNCLFYSVNRSSSFYEALELRIEWSDSSGFISTNTSSTLISSIWAGNSTGAILTGSFYCYFWRNSLFNLLYSSIWPEVYSSIFSSFSYSSFSFSSYSYSYSFSFSSFISSFIYFSASSPTYRFSFGIFCFGLTYSGFLAFND